MDYCGINRLAIIASLLTVATAGNVMASPIEALSFPNGVGFYADTSNFAVSNFNVGWSFTVNSPIVVTSLGYFDGGSLGLNESHNVGIYTSTGTLLTSATVAAGTAEPLVASTGTQPANGFRYQAISAYILAPGSYSIAGLVGTTFLDDF